MASPQYAFSMGKLEIVQSTRGMHSNLFISYNKIDILTKVIKRMILLLYICTQKAKRRRDLRGLAATRGCIESDRFQWLDKLKTVTELFQGFDMEEKRFVAERLSLSQEGGALQQQVFLWATTKILYLPFSGSRSY